MTGTTNVNEVTETQKKTEVNRLIKLGWILLNTASGQWCDTNEAYFYYSLGWDKPLPSNK